MARLGSCRGQLAVRSASTRQEVGSWPTGSDQFTGVTCGDVDQPGLPLASLRPAAAVVGCVSGSART
jgi:hypothetical protein